jgi:hypothetical protein
MPGCVRDSLIIRRLEGRSKINEAVAARFRASVSRAATEPDGISKFVAVRGFAVGTRRTLRDVRLAAHSRSVGNCWSGPAASVTVRRTAWWVAVGLSGASRDRE